MRVAHEGGIPRREVWKKFLRNFKKALDKRKRLWYNSQAVPPRAARSLKIEQQERLYKALRSAKYEISSIKSYIYSTK